MKKKGWTNTDRCCWNRQQSSWIAPPCPEETMTTVAAAAAAPKFVEDGAWSFHFYKSSTIPNQLDRFHRFEFRFLKKKILKNFSPRFLLCQPNRRRKSLETNQMKTNRGRRYSTYCAVVFSRHVCIFRCDALSVYRRDLPAAEFRVGR